MWSSVCIFYILCFGMALANAFVIVVVVFLSLLLLFLLAHRFVVGLVAFVIVFIVLGIRIVEINEFVRIA